VQSQWIKQGFISIFFSIREAGKPRPRWLQNVENDLRELKVKIWGQRTSNGNESVPALKAAKFLTGP
jgi:hypothetical protein